jgi:hypothetical protein
MSQAHTEEMLVEREGCEMWVLPAGVSQRMFRAMIEV